MRIVICDDNPRDNQIIKQYVISNFDEYSEGVVDSTYSASELIKFCLKEEPDIFFLDIELGDMNGIELAKVLRNKFPTLIIVYITNHPNYVFSSFETEPLNFLTKPIDRFQFNKTYQRIIKKYTEIHRSIPIKWQNDSVNLEIKDICYIEGYNRHLVFRLYNGDSYEVVGKIDDIYKALKIHGFVKSHQGYIVNMLYIKEFGESEIYMKNGEIVLMSVRKRLKTKETYTNYLNRRF